MWQPPTCSCRTGRLCDDMVHLDTLGPVSRGRRFRRHAHRVATTPRRGWRRTFRYKRGLPGWFLSDLVVTPISEDAPYGDQDAKFWDWVLIGLLVAILIGVLVTVLIAVA